MQALIWRYSRGSALAQLPPKRPAGMGGVEMRSISTPPTRIPEQLGMVVLTAELSQVLEGRQRIDLYRLYQQVDVNIFIGYVA